MANKSIRAAGAALLLLLPWLIACQPARLLSAAPATVATSQASRIRSILQEEADAGFSGVILVTQSGQPVLHEAFSTDPTVGRDARFWIGSLTKPVLGAAILRLQEQGRLSVQDRITRFFRDVPSDKQGITIHHLLTHTSGLPHAYSSEGVTDRQIAVRTILALPLERPPGTAASYSNDAFSLLAAIVEVASRRPYEEYIRQEILDRAGMASTGFWPPHPSDEGFAAIANVPPPRTAVPNWGYRGASGLSSTATDLLSFFTALREGRILRPENVGLVMSARFSRENTASIGYGWFIDNLGRVTHSGAEDGLQHFGWIHWLPQGQTTVILLSNSPEERAVRANRRVLAAIRE